jgi:hypothetical protein
VYTSWLSRAIETAWLVLSELDLLWLPIVKVSRQHEFMNKKRSTARSFVFPLSVILTAMAFLNALFRLCLVVAFERAHVRRTDGPEQADGQGATRRRQVQELAARISHAAATRQQLLAVLPRQ